MSSDHGDRFDGVDLGELSVIVTELIAAVPELANADGVALLMIAVQLQRNAILNDTAVINGNIADALSDLAAAHAIPGDRKLH